MPEKTAKVRFTRYQHNRRIYDNQTHAYVTLPQIRRALAAGELIRGLPPSEGDQVTRQVLAQIVVHDIETGSGPSAAALRELIRAYS